MKLGIIVVYLIKEEDEKLLDLHLNSIEKHTKVPYRIYGSVARLSSKYRQRLMQHHRVKICECDCTELRDALEHGFYLEQLVKCAVRDGATHIAILHVDSFPISSDWVEVLDGKLSAQCVLAATTRAEKYDRKPFTACMFFHRDFYLKCRPTFHLSSEQLSSQTYKDYITESALSYEARYESGIGYGFTIHKERLTWHPMVRSNRGENHYGIGSIYGNLIFHLGSANRKLKCFLGDDEQSFEIGKVRKKLVTFRKKFAPLLPNKLRRQVDSFIPRTVVDFLFPQYRSNEEAYRIVKERLLNDPESYLDFLRTGKSQSSSQPLF
jgi:hypothetical protein